MDSYVTAFGMDGINCVTRRKVHEVLVVENDSQDSSVCVKINELPVQADILVNGRHFVFGDNVHSYVGMGIVGVILVLVSIVPGLVAIDVNHNYLLVANL